MILRCVILTLIASISISHGELVETECGYIEVTDRGLQCEFNNIFTFETTDVNIIETNSSIDAVSFRQSEIYAIPADMFIKFPHVKHLDVELTQLKVIKPDNFRNANHLKYFLARFNEVKRLESETFAAAPQLKFIVLQYNQISSIDELAFKGLNYLEALYLDYNQMISLPSKILDNTPNLLHFSMAYNNLTSIPDDLFIKNEKLETMNLGHNMLKRFNDAQFDTLPNLERVQLDHNNLTELDLVACKSSEINVDKNQLKVIELNKWTRLLSAWGNPVSKLVLHEHYGTGRSYNFSFNQVNEIVFYVHEHCCTLENLENFYIITQSFGDLSQKRLDVNDWSCTFAKTNRYETTHGFVTDNICRKFKGFSATQSTTTTTTQVPSTTVQWMYTRNPTVATIHNRIQNIEDTIDDSDEDENTSDSLGHREFMTSTRSPLFSGFDLYDASTTTKDPFYYPGYFEPQSTTEDYERKAEQGLWKTIKKKVGGIKNNVVRKWNDWVG